MAERNRGPGPQERPTAQVIWTGRSVPVSFFVFSINKSLHKHEHTLCARPCAHCGRGYKGDRATILPSRTQHIKGALWMLGDRMELNYKQRQMFAFCNWQRDVLAET